MTTDIPNIQHTDKDYLEMLLHKLSVMKFHGSNYYARKQDTDKRMFDKARKEVNDFMLLLKKRGYSGDRFNVAKLEQGRLI